MWLVDEKLYRSVHSINMNELMMQQPVFRSHCRVVRYWKQGSSNFTLQEARQSGRSCSTSQVRHEVWSEVKWGEKIIVLACLTSAWPEWHWPHLGVFLRRSNGWEALAAPSIPSCPYSGFHRCSTTPSRSFGGVQYTSYLRGAGHLANWTAIDYLPNYASRKQ